MSHLGGSDPTPSRRTALGRSRSYDTALARETPARRSPTRYGRDVIEQIEDAADPRIGEYTGLRDFALRLRREGPGGDLSGVFITEGAPVIERAIAARYSMRSLLLDAQRYDRFGPLLNQAGATTFVAAREVLEAITGFNVHRGVLACFERKPLEPVEAVIADARKIAILESINNHTNVGAIFRCAAALSIDAVLLCPFTCDPLYRRALRVSMGHALAIPHTRVERLPDGLAIVKQLGFRTLALTPSLDAVSIRTVDPSGKLALIFGAEGEGLTEQTMAAAHLRVRIPLADGIDSLNVGAAAAVAFYALGG